MVGSATSRLIIIRGNSGSGKSALAAAVRAARPHRTVAIVGQDVIRRQILGTGDDLGNSAIGLIDLTARYALDHGFDVVVEGILKVERYGDMLRTLVAAHGGVSRCYRYEVPFEETIRRHRTKPNAADFGEVEMREWWHGFEPVGGLHESVIAEASSLAEAAARVLREAWCRTD